MKPVNNPAFKAVTLLELIMAVVLLSIIVIGFSSIEMFSRSHIIGADRRTQLQNSASLVLEHMTKQAKHAVGNADYDQPVKVYDDLSGIRIRIDNNTNGIADSTDRWIAYRHENITGGIDSEIRFYPDAGQNDPPGGTSESIARKIAIGEPGFSIAGDFNATGQLIGNSFEVNVTCRWIPNQPKSIDNPEVSLRTQVSLPAVSLN